MKLDYLHNNIFLNYKRFLENQDSNKDFNIFQVTKFPHYEVVSSRVLEFFFNPSGLHGLGTLFLEALSDFLFTDGAKQAFINANWEIETEVATNKQNRIDVLLKSDDYSVAIENKIYAAEYNDLNDYFNYVQSEFDSKHTYGVVLSLRPTKFQKKGWINITYHELFQCVNKILGNYFIGSNTKGLMFLHDFMENFEILKEGNRLNMSNPKQLVDFESFLEENYLSIINVDRDLKEYKKECIYLVEGTLQIFDSNETKHEINTNLSDKLSISGEKNYLKNIFKFTPGNEPMASLVIDTYLTNEPDWALATDFEFGYEKVLGRSGLTVKIFFRGKSGGAARKKGYTDNLTEILNGDYRKDGKIIYHFINENIWDKTDLELFELINDKYTEILTDLHSVGIETGERTR